MPWNPNLLCPTDLKSVQKRLRNRVTPALVSISFHHLVFIMLEWLLDMDLHLFDCVLISLQFASTFKWQWCEFRIVKNGLLAEKRTSDSSGLWRIPLYSIPDQNNFFQIAHSVFLNWRLWSKRYNPMACSISLIASHHQWDSAVSHHHLACLELISHYLTGWTLNCLVFACQCLRVAVLAPLLFWWSVPCAAGYLDKVVASEIPTFSFLGSWCWKYRILY